MASQAVFDVPITRDQSWTAAIWPTVTRSIPLSASSWTWSCRRTRLKIQTRTPVDESNTFRFGTRRESYLIAVGMLGPARDPNREGTDFCLPQTTSSWRTSLLNRARQRFSRTWTKTVSLHPGCRTHSYSTVHASNKASQSFTHALSTSEGAESEQLFSDASLFSREIGMRRVCLLASRTLTLKMPWPSPKLDNWFWDSGGRVTRPTW